MIFWVFLELADLDGGLQKKLSLFQFRSITEMFRCLSQNDVNASWSKKYNTAQLRQIVSAIDHENVALKSEFSIYLETPASLLQFLSKYSDYPGMSYTLKELPNFIFAAIQYLSDLGHGKSLHCLGNAYHWRGDYDAAVNYLTLASQVGDTPSLWMLAATFEQLALVRDTGLKGPEAVKAVAVYKQAASAKPGSLCLLSICRLADAYKTGYGVDANLATAFEYNMIAADLGPKNFFHVTSGGTSNVSALYNIGLAYLEGHPFAAKSENNAAIYFRRAASVLDCPEVDAEEFGYKAAYELGMLAENRCANAIVRTPPTGNHNIQAHLQSAIFWMQKAESEGEDWLCTMGYN